MNIGVIGIGNMGLAIALRLRDQGHEVVVRDIDAAREQLALVAGCQIAADPAELAARCSLVIVVVVDGQQSREVVLGQRGIVESLERGGSVMLCPTISPADTEALAGSLADRGIACIDAPMSGGPVRARAGTMSLMVACEDAAFAQWQGVMGQIASPVYRVGRRAGDGARTKLVNNLLAAVNLAGACEALALAERLGLDPALTLSVIEQSSGQSWIGSDRLRRALADERAPQAHVGLLAKDSSLAIEAAVAAGFSTPVGDSAQRCFALAVAAGLAAADDSALWRWMLEGRPTDQGASRSSPLRPEDGTGR